MRRDGFGGSDRTELHQRLVHLVGVAHIGPGVLAHAGDRAGIQQAEVAHRACIAEPPRLHRLRAAFLERRIIEESIWRGIQRLRGKRTRRGEVAGDDVDAAAFQSAQHLQPALGIHRLAQAIGE